MELKLSEMDTMNPYDRFDYKSYQQDNGENYWEKPKTQETQTKKKKVSFNDILSNMNLVVNKEGVLQFMAPTKEFVTQEQQYTSQNNDYNYNANQFNYQPNFNQQLPNQFNQPPNQFNQQLPNQFNQQPNQFNQPQQINNSEPLDPSVKHSYIYNKYFKDYADPNIGKPLVRVPKTMEEYYQMLLDDKRRAVEHKLRMDQIKSKKLLFTAPESGAIVNPRNIVPSKNNLRSMTFH
jgi:hypothetical protein